MRRSLRRSPARRRDAAATRARLLEQGRRAFAQHGLAATRLRRDILEPAGVSVGSFYHQFANKTELLLAVLEEDGKRLRALFREVHRPRPGRTIEAIARDAYALVFEVAERHEDTLRILHRESESPDPRIRRFVEEDRRRWVESLTADYERIARAAGLRFDVKLTAELVSLLAKGLLHRLLESPSPRGARERARLVEGLVRFTLGGVSGLAPEACGRQVERPLPRTLGADQGGKHRA